ncbi:host attachment protein [Luteolibacter flavescens]|uniref:Host attachment protein n=1 Tax=Luteolibacter flavescens TaxID=1859460 RepID=A0ABT3FR30_9BACT|nr:host attachment protein [Luteolibacter flavescens]MCW1886051.1 host attachment protein [Luteolibacter flavescens]
MRPLPSILVVADRGKVLAYLTGEDDVPRLHATTTFKEGTEKISDLVTDQAGAFPTPGGHGTSSAERLPLKEELEARCIRQIASMIEEWLAMPGVTSWGLCAPSQIHGAILEQVSRDTLERLSSKVKKDLVNASPAEVREAFGAPATVSSHS